MNMAALLKRGEAIGRDAQAAAIKDIYSRIELPRGMSAEPMPGGLRLSGKRLKQLYITDPIFMNKLS